MKGVIAKGVDEHLTMGNGTWEMGSLDFLFSFHLLYHGLPVAFERSAVILMTKDGNLENPPLGLMSYIYICSCT